MNPYEFQLAQELSFLYGGTTDYRKLTKSKKDKVINKLLSLKLKDKEEIEKELSKILMKRKMKGGKY